MNDSEKFRNMSADDLAKIQDGLRGNPYENILIENEWRRRERIEQHKLDLEILFKQGKWMMVSAFIGLLGVIIGVLLTVFLTTNLTKEPEQSPPAPSTQTDQRETFETKEPSQTKIDK